MNNQLDQVPFATCTTEQTFCSIAQSLTLWYCSSTSLGLERYASPYFSALRSLSVTYRQARSNHCTIS